MPTLELRHSAASAGSVSPIAHCVFPIDTLTVRKNKPAKAPGGKVVKPR